MPAFIDLPNGSIPERSFTVAGWIASNAANPDVALRVGGSPVPFVFYPRPDVRTALASQHFAFTSGVMAVIDDPSLGAGQTVTIELTCDGEGARKTCRVNTVPAPRAGREAPTVMAAPVAEAVTLRQESRVWCVAHLRCTWCGGAGSELEVMLAQIVCRRCGTAFPQHTAALDLMSADDRIRGGVVPSGNISANPYTPDALALIERATSSGGWVLDCGAGARPQRLAHVVNLEIVDYASTDVLGIGEALPFADESFDAILSLAVLEHVRDPFGCAREILRVLKPGGEVLADVPLLQPVHGYPDHYYNMTQSGLTNLFGTEVEVLDRRVPPHGHPIFAAQWLLGAYLGGLPDDARAAFGAMTVAEVASLSPHRFLSEPPAVLLSQESQATIACLNSLRVRKRPR